MRSRWQSYARRCLRWLRLPAAFLEVEVVEGCDGHLFLTGDTNDVMGQITGRVRGTPRHFAAIAAAHEVRAKLCGTHGIDYRHVICPNKESIQVTRLPSPYVFEAHGPSYAAQYLATAPAVRPFYDRACLIGRDDAYFRTDTHWTEVGATAYLDMALRHWNDQRALAALRALDPTIASVVLPTDLGTKMGRGPETSVGLHLPNGVATVLLQSAVLNKGHVRWQRSLGTSVAGTRALVLHDSFGLYLFRSLSELYAETLFIHDHDFDAAFVLRYRPDVVWLLQAERFLPKIPRNDTDVVSMVARNERRKKASTRGSDFLRETWPR